MLMLYNIKKQTGLCLKCLELPLANHHFPGDIFLRSRTLFLAGRICWRQQLVFTNRNSMECTAPLSRIGLLNDTFPKELECCVASENTDSHQVY
jgi:hypothetical protein